MKRNMNNLLNNIDIDKGKTINYLIETEEESNIIEEEIKHKKKILKPEFPGKKIITK